MRGSQSDPTHTYAPVCPCLRLRYARVDAGRRVRVRARYYHAAHHAVNLQPYGQQGLLHRFGAGDLKGLERAFGAGLWYGLARAFWGPCWPDLGGLAGALRMACNAGNARAGLQCLFSLYASTALCGHTVCKGMA